MLFRGTEISRVEAVRNLHAALDLAGVHRRTGSVSAFASRELRGAYGDINPHVARARVYLRGARELNALLRDQ